MALQLVYTSAPRLLQAGRTGFGTVAMHSGIPSWLQSEIEGFSQFSRLPGLDTSRVILCHTILGQGARKHHVFSRIQDCGADYTGRTNHIAHHFIFTASEIIQATKLGLTPVDVLAYLNNGLWKTTWSGDASILDSEDELAIISIPKNTLTLPALAYWGHLCPEHPEYAAILAPSKLSEACWLVYPTGWSEPIIYALGESLLLHTNPWAVTFTNNLQPTDNEQLFAWRCIPSDSPLLEKATSSVRPCIDLSDPSPFLTGIPHDLLEQARTGKKPLPKPRAIGKAVPPPSDFSANQSSEQETAIPAPSLNRASGPITQITRPNVGLSSLKRKSHKQEKPVFLIAAISIVFVLILGGSAIVYSKYEDNKRFESRKEKTFTEWSKIVKDTKLDKDKLTETDCNDLNDFIQHFNDNNWIEVEKSIKNLDKSGGDRNDINTTMRIAYEEKTKELLAVEYSKLSKSEDFSKIDVKDLKGFVEKLQSTENAKWTKAIDLLSYLKDSTKTPVPPVTENSLPSESPKIKEASKNLLAQYVQKYALPKVDNTASGPVVETRDQTVASHPVESIQPTTASQPGEVKDQTTPPTQLPTAPGNPPIYVFFGKPDYEGLDEKNLDLIPNEINKYNFKDLTITDNISPLTIDAEFNKAGEKNSVKFNQNEVVPCFAVLDKNHNVKHIVLTDNKTFSKILDAYEKKPYELLYNITDNTFQFNPAFMKTLARLKNGKKFVETGNEDQNFTFTWELKVKGYDFLNSNGTILSENIPTIEREKITRQLENHQKDMKGKQEIFLREVKTFDPDFNQPDNNLEKIIQDLIDKRSNDRTTFFKTIKERIYPTPTTDTQKSSPSKNTEKDSEFKTIRKVLKKETENLDLLFKEFKNKKFNDKELASFIQEFNAIGLEHWDQKKLEDKFKELNKTALQNILEKPWQDYTNIQTKVNSLQELWKKNEVPINFTLKFHNDTKSFNIEGFPINPSQPPGGQQ